MRFFRIPVYFLFLWTLAAIPAHAVQEPVSGGQQEESETDQFRHSAAVQSFGHAMHMDTEAAARTFEYVNFAILAGAVLFGLGKVLPKTFRGNREQIQQQLVEARTVTQQSNDRLAAIEKKLGQLDQEIASIRDQAEKDSLEDEARIKASIEVERKRIVDTAQKDIAASAGAAQRDLKRFAASLAIERATEKIALSADDDHLLIQDFLQQFSQTFTQKRGNN